MPADGILRTQSGFAYPVTADDKIWLARAAKYEGRADARETIWALAQRFALVHGSRFPTFKSLIQAYAQPVNPIWRRDGSKCRPGGEYAGTDPCAPHRLDVRDRAAVDPSPETMPLVEAWVRGEVPNTVPRAVHYAVPRLVQNCLDDGDCVSLILEGAAGNWYASSATSERWPRSFVTISGTGERTSLGLWVAAGAASAVGVGVALAGGFRFRRSRPRRRRSRR